MRKLSVIMMLLCMGWIAAQAQCQDGPYGLQINGTKVVDAPLFGDPDGEGRVQYKAACVELKAGDKLKLINKSCDATWMIDIDQYGEYQNFSGGKSAGELTCNVEGKYDFYIKLSASVGDVLYIGPGSGCDGESDCQDGPYGLQINGKTIVDAPLYGDEDMQGRVQYMASCVDLKAGDVIQLINKSCGATWMVNLDEYGYYENFSGGKDANKLTCNVAGKYDFYIKLSIQAGDLVYVETSQTCGGGGADPMPGYTTSAPAKCPDVMLQAFYWDSYQNKGYGRTKWKDHLEGVNGSNAEELGQWFDLIWLPPMSKATGGTGYIPSKYSELNSDWGTKAKLEQMIEIFHKNGARVVADIVINHGAAWSGWCDFAQLNFGSYGTFKPDASWICSTDEMNYSSEAGSCKGKATGNPDDGYYGDDDKDYRSARDWDHTQQKVRDMFKAYLKWLRNDIKIDGFRYDYCKGFHNSHINDYNTSAKAYFSVMEMWDGNVNTLQSHLNDAGYNTLTFDFAMKYTAFNDGIASDNYCALKGAGLPGAGKARYAVTFLDSHDSFQRDNNEFCGAGNSMGVCKDKIMQCYAYMLSMPGVPCVFWPHWVTFKDQLKPLINARYKTGVHSESGVTDECGNGYYKATITGTNGEIRLLVGPNSGYGSTPSGYTLAGKGTNYGVYYKVNSVRGDKNTERQDRTQGIEDVQQAQPAGVKFIQNGQLYIRCGEQVYDIMGRPIK
jgi:alpha-amylase